MLELLKDLWGFMLARRKFWLAPIIFIYHGAFRRTHRADAGLGGSALYLHLF